jgi:hypothetical protein
MLARHRKSDYPMILEGKRKAHCGGEGSGEDVIVSENSKGHLQEEGKRCA